MRACAIQEAPVGPCLPGPHVAAGLPLCLNHSEPLSLVESQGVGGVGGGAGLCPVSAGEDTQVCNYTFIHSTSILWYKDISISLETCSGVLSLGGQAQTLFA